MRVIREEEYTFVTNNRSDFHAPLVSEGLSSPGLCRERVAVCWNS